MTWQGILGHDQQVERFRRAVLAGKLPSTFLFVGAAGIGKHSFAIELAKALHCQTHADEQLLACGSCPSCRQVAAGVHPDILQVGLPEGKATIPLKLLVGDIDHRMREGFCFDMSLKPMASRWRIGVIDSAGRMGRREVQNSILKTLEEPPAHGLLILVAENEEQMIPTIRSRCQLVRFQPLASGDVRQILLDQGHLDDPERAGQLAALSQGSVGRALEMNQQDLLDFRLQFLGLLGRSDAALLDKVELVSDYVDGAAKEAYLRRERLQDAVGVAIDFYQQLMRHSAGGQVQADQPLTQAVQQKSQQQALEAEGIADQLDLCLEAQQDIRRNVNIANIIPAWLAELHTA